MNPTFDLEAAQDRVNDICLAQARHSVLVSKLVAAIRNHPATETAEKAAAKLNKANYDHDQTLEERNLLERQIRRQISAEKAAEKRRDNVRQIVCALLTDPYHSEHQARIIEEAIEIETQIQALQA